MKKKTKKNCWYSLEFKWIERVYDYLLKILQRHFSLEEGEIGEFDSLEIE